MIGSLGRIRLPHHTFALFGSFLLSGCSFLLDFEELRGDDSLSPDAGQEPEPGVATDTGSEETDSTETDTGTPSPEPSPDTDTAEPDTDDTGVEPDVLPDGGLAGGNDGSVGEACPLGCDDGDPCTTDTCTATGCSFTPMQCEASDSCMVSECVNGACVERPFTGVAPDGYSQTVSADAVYNTQLVAAGDRFYSATYGEFGGRKDIRLAAFDRDGEEGLDPQSLASGLSSNYTIASPAAVVADTRLGLELNVYVAIREIVGGTPAELGNLIRVLFNADLGLVTESVPFLADSQTYLAVTEQMGPAAGRAEGASADDDPYVVWYGENGAGQRGIFMQSGDTPLNVDALGNNFVAEDRVVVGVTSLDSGGNPGAVWMTNPNAGGSVLMSATASGEPAIQLSQCRNETALSGYDLYTTRTLGDVWTVTWSQMDGAGAFVTENTILQCNEASCLDAGGQGLSSGMCTAEQLDDRVTEDVHNLVLQSFQRTEEPDVLYQAIVLVAEDDLGMFVNRVDYGSSAEAGDFSRVGDAALASGSSTTRPRQPSIAFLPPDKIGVSWIQPAEDGSGDELHFERHRVCFQR